MVVSNYASSLGQKIGKVFQSAVHQYLEPQIQQLGGTIQSEKIPNGDNFSYDIDLVVRDSNNRIVVLIETKFVRYKKHNRDKGSWIINTHQKLRRTHDTIEGCYAIMLGNWSKPSLEMIKKSGIGMALVEFEHLSKVYQKYGVNIQWGEKDEDLKRNAYYDEMNLSMDDRQKIGTELIEDILPTLDEIGSYLNKS